jgi:EAL domain-containing protein (putative c-di-GMP-specific phosphodiesterase class I)
MEDADLAPFLSDTVGIFIGGDSLWKEQTAARWAALARSCGAWCHMGRVNTRERVRICQAAGVDSMDGSSGSRFAVTVPQIAAWVAQTHAWEGRPFAKCLPRAEARHVPRQGEPRAETPAAPESSQLSLWSSYA